MVVQIHHAPPTEGRADPPARVTLFERRTNCDMRVSSNGRASAFQADDDGSNPFTRSRPMTISGLADIGYARLDSVANEITMFIG